MTNNADRLVHRLLDIGLSQEMVDLSLPEWWVAEDYESLSARAMASMLLARRLNLDPTTLLDDEVPVGFLHTGVSKFKHMRLTDSARRNALVGVITENPSALNRIRFTFKPDHVRYGFALSYCPLPMRDAKILKMRCD